MSDGTMSIMRCYMEKKKMGGLDMWMWLVSSEIGYTKGIIASKMEQKNGPYKRP